MPTTIIADFNCGMERVFVSKVNGVDNDLAKDPNLRVFFDLIDPNTSNEHRQLRIVDKQSGTLLLTVKLNNKGGVKPTNGLIAQHKPAVRPNPTLQVPCDVDVERAFFAETDLSDISDVQVFFRIEPDNPPEIDVRRFLLLTSTDAGFPPTLQNRQINLNDSFGGKKPLGGDND